MSTAALETWFSENKRDFPWRINPTPYRVWISEIMLQQTRAVVVIPYFLRWMEIFPNVQSLYQASLEEVIKAWEGLGYYSRARAIHRAAKQIVEEFEGIIPDTEENLRKLQGFGPYTTGALLNFAFHKKALAIDGNVLRVISRLFCIEEEISTKSAQVKIQEKNLSLLNQTKTPWITQEALIELGAQICTKTPRCSICPLKDFCLSAKEGKETLLPMKKEREKIISIFRIVFVFKYNHKVLLRKETSKKIMKDLYEFPFLEIDQKKPSFAQIEKGIRHFIKSKWTDFQHMTPCSHTFTKYKSHLFPLHIELKQDTQVTGYEWFGVSDLKTLPFSAGHRKIAIETQNKTI